MSVGFGAAPSDRINRGGKVPTGAWRFTFAWFGLFVSAVSGPLGLSSADPDQAIGLLVLVFIAVSGGLGVLLVAESQWSGTTSGFVRFCGLVVFTLAFRDVGDSWVMSIVVLIVLLAGLTAFWASVRRCGQSHWKASGTAALAVIVTFVVVKGVLQEFELGLLGTGFFFFFGLWAGVEVVGEPAQRAFAQSAQENARRRKARRARKRAARRCAQPCGYGQLHSYPR